MSGYGSYDKPATVPEGKADPLDNEVLRSVAAQVHLAQEYLACGLVCASSRVLKELQKVLPAPGPRNLLAARGECMKGE